MTPTKRTSSSNEEDEISNKRPRCSENEVRVAGCIEKVYMKNFMCHSALEVILNKRINFIVGRNGSGKSATLAAVVIAFGCRASSTNRASALKDFVKKGASSATVQITMNNEGLYAYKPEVYGPKIIVIRTIYIGSTPSAYKFKSAKGEIISTKREELQKIVAAFNIQVDNPVCVLNQDTARTFLATSDTKSKYSIFMKATRLEDVDNLHSKTLNTEENAKERLKLRKESLLQQQSEIKDLEKKAKAVHKMQEMKKMITKLENELAWTMVHAEEQKLTNVKIKMNAKKERLQPFEDLVEQCKEKLENKTSQLRELEQTLKEMNRNRNVCDERLTKAVKESKEAQTKYQTVLVQWKQLEKQTIQTNHDMQTVKQEIAKHRGNQENRQELARLNEAIDKCKLELDKILAIQQTTEMEYQNLRGEFDHYREQESLVRTDKRTVELAIDSKKRQLENLRVQSNNLGMYGDWMPRLVQRIEENFKKGKFVRRPLGPLGALLKVQDAQWARAIELEIGSVLRSFACHCGQDAQILRNLFKEVISTGYKFPGILVSKFTDKIHNIHSTCVRAPGYQNIFDILHFPDPNVANCLIDNCSIEGILLIPSGKEASRMMSQNVPKNCKKSITQCADQYFPYPDYRMYAGNPRARVSLLQVSKEDVIRQLQGEIQAEQQNMLQLDAKLQELNGNILKNKDMLKKIERRIMDLRASKAKFNAEKNEYESAIDLLPNPQHFLTLQSELDELSKKICDLTEQKEVADEKSNNLKVETTHAKQACEVIRMEVQELEEKRQTMLIRVERIKEATKKEEMKISDYQAAQAAHNSDLSKLKELLEKQEKEIEIAVHKASSVCSQRVPAKRQIEVIQNEIMDCKSYQNTVEEENGRGEDVLQILQEKKEKYNNNIQQMSDLETGLKALMVSLMERKKLYISIRRIMAMRVLYVFNPLLGTRGYKGDMKFDHQARTLDVDVTPKEEKGKRDTKSLSGGERSYSTVAFILSLWECVEPPFYFLDEFDVFMDKVNRRVVIELLLSHAEGKKNHQYVFLTPQETSTVTPSEDVTIHRLDDPERTSVS